MPLKPWDLGVALVIVVVGLMLASMAAQAILARAPRNAPLLAWAARGAILFFAAALALHQAGLPAEIVTIAFASVVGGVAIGLAVVAGIGFLGVRIWQGQKNRKLHAEFMQRFADYEKDEVGETA